jgi:hypothetical protein
MDSFSKCVDSGRYAGLVMDRYNLAREIGLTRLPALSS